MPPGCGSTISFPSGMQIFFTGCVNVIKLGRYLRSVVALLAEVLNELHQPVNHQLHGQHHALQLLPRRRRGVCTRTKQQNHSHGIQTKGAEGSERYTLPPTKAPGLWSMLASSSRCGLRLVRLAGSPVLCRTIVSSWTLFANDSGD